MVDGKEMQRCNDQDDSRYLLGKKQEENDESGEKVLKRNEGLCVRIEVCVLIIKQCILQGKKYRSGLLKTQHGSSTALRDCPIGEKKVMRMQCIVTFFLFYLFTTYPSTQFVHRTGAVRRCR